MSRKVKSVIHVNRAHIAANTKDGGTRPVFTIKRAGKTTYGRGVTIHGPSAMVAPGKALSCGARAWCETESPITIQDAMTYAESCQFAGES